MHDISFKIFLWKFPFYIIIVKEFNIVFFKIKGIIALNLKNCESL